MRPFWLAIAILIAGPARADVTARYAMGPEPNSMPAMVVEVNDRGDSRVVMGNAMAVLTLDGVTYLLMADLRGTFVARQDDAIAMVAEQARALMSSQASTRSHETPPPRLSGPDAGTVQGGTETVGGRTGTIWWLRTGREASPTDMDFVVCTDPDLAPVGRVLAQQLAASRSAAGQMIGPEITNGRGGLFDGIVAIFERGTVIRWSRLYRLESVDSHPISASEFVLPSAPLTRAQLEARLGWGPAPAAAADRAH
jgi:hypothetical protein